MPLSLGIVGWTFSELDFPVVASSYKLIGAPEKPLMDYIDLSLGRDFLKEDKKYDVVVLIYIFKCTPEELTKEECYFLNKSQRVSELHSRENWRRRLLNTNAKDVFIHGMYVDSEISGEYIGDLENYEMQLIELKTSLKGSRKKFHYGNIWHYHKVI
jgi:hypothetical protein